LIIIDLLKEKGLDPKPELNKEPKLPTRLNTKDFNLFAIKKMLLNFCHQKYPKITHLHLKFYHKIKKNNSINHLNKILKLFNTLKIITLAEDSGLEAEMKTPLSITLLKMSNYLIKLLKN
jgi:hypothetical protein